eukprot:Pompholyxophrys_punicea_v1_NODE_2_length_10808_cov_35.677950.p14 type:complete len:103 gc:universal NODE_2_length_10808_cov_35.677950:4925-4617(-)
MRNGLVALPERYEDVDDAADAKVLQVSGVQASTKKKRIRWVKMIPAAAGMGDYFRLIADQNSFSVSSGFAASFVVFRFFWPFFFPLDCRRRNKCKRFPGGRG